MRNMRSSALPVRVPLDYQLVCMSEVMSRHAPTAAFLRLAIHMRKTMKRQLSPHARMLAMLAREPSTPTKGIPHSGFTPTGAIVGSAEEPFKTDGSCF